MSSVFNDIPVAPKPKQFRRSVTVPDEVYRPRLRMMVSDAEGAAVSSTHRGRLSPGY